MQVGLPKEEVEEMLFLQQQNIEEYKESQSFRAVRAVHLIKILNKLLNVTEPIDKPGLFVLWRWVFIA